MIFVPSPSKDTTLKYKVYRVDEESVVSPWYQPQEAKLTEWWSGIVNDVARRPTSAKVLPTLLSVHHSLTANDMTVSPTTLEGCPPQRGWGNSPATKARHSLELLPVYRPYKSAVSQGSSPIPCDITAQAACQTFWAPA